MDKKDREKKLTIHYDPTRDISWMINMEKFLLQGSRASQTKAKSRQLSNE
jgi:hypothetical protein